MTDTTVIFEHFTVTYRRRFSDGEIVDWFLGYDASGDGRPCFEPEPADQYLRDNLVDAIKDAAMMETNMKTYYGHEYVNFDSICVVRFKTVIETIDDIAEAHHEALVESAAKKLSAEELAALIASQAIRQIQAKG